LETSPANSTTTRTACWEHDSFRERASPIFDAPKPLALWHLTSLDAPTVAVVWTLAFAWTAHIALPAWVPILLALVAWPVYIADRLFDARSAHTTAQLHRLRLRHHFHWRHRQVLFPIALASACAAAIVILSFMPIAARERNTVLAAAALVYFSCVHFPRRFSPSLSRILAKESLVAILFTAACVLPVLTRAGAINPAQLWPLLLSAVFFTLLAWLNCHAIERWESDGESSRSAVFTPALLLAIAGLLLSAILVAVRHPRTAALVAAATCSVLLLVLLDRQRHRLTPLALRTAADLVLLTPLALLFQ
jgi:hypothetical protein